jgi:hypothetical protein
MEKPKLNIDRTALREEVTDRAERTRRKETNRGAPSGTAERLAIEQVLTKRGLLRREAGGWC